MVDTYISQDMSVFILYGVYADFVILRIYLRKHVCPLSSKTYILYFKTTFLFSSHSIKQRKVP